MYLLRGALALFLVSIVYFNLQAQIISDFASSADGWTIFNTSSGSSTAAVYSGTGGNPSGYISDPGTTSGPTIFYAEAPAKFRGNFSLSYNQNLTFDLKQSTAGTDNTNSDIIIANAAASLTLVYQLPVKPATATFTSYTIQLNETFSGWHVGSVGGAAPSKDQMKLVLSNITSVRIRLKYTLSNTFTVTGSLDNVVLNTPTLTSPPTISSFTPNSGVPGTASVTINGTNFGVSAAANAVYFGGVKATIASASSTKLIVTVPKGALNAPIIVENLTTGLSTSTIQSFIPLFDNNKDYGGQIIRASLSNPVAFDVQVNGTKGNVAVGDIDGDGLNDLIVGEGAGGFSGSKQFSVYRNAGQTGSISSSSFAAKVSIITAKPYTKGYVALADFDGDSKLDVVLSSADNSYAYISVYRNTSTSGSISFAAEQNWPAYSYSDGPLTAADMDGDGRPEILGVFNNNCASGDRLYVYQNMSTVGNIDFAYYVTFSNVYTCGGNITVGDLTGDKLNDVVVTAGSNSVTVFQNTSTPGALSMAAAFQLSTTSYGNAVIADLDQDGLNDLAWPYYASQNIIIKKNNYIGGVFDATAFGSDIFLASPLGYIQDELATGDFNGDGKIDLVLAGSTDIAIFENVSSTGSLTASSFLEGVPFATTGASAYPLSPLIADFDNDNKQDIVMRLSNVGNVGALLIYHNESFPAPQINSFTPVSGTYPMQVTLTGINLKTGSGTPVSRLSGISVTTTPVNNTSTNVNIPLGSTSGKFSIIEHGLIGMSKPFKFLFATSQVITASSFGPSIDFALSTNTRDALEVADFDDDGKEDVVVIDNLNTAKIFQNAATTGQSINGSSLALQGTTYTSGYNVVALDIDGDGKVDLNNGYGLLQNTSTSGSISFLSGPNGVYTYAAGFNYVASADFNNDGKIDLAVTNGTASIQIYENQSNNAAFVNNNYLSTFKINAISLSKPNNYGGVVAEDFDGDGYVDIISSNQTAGTLTYFLNTKTYGSIINASFSFLGNYSTSGSQPIGLTANDFDGDGKMDIAVTYYNSAIVSVYLNNSSAGDISFSAPLDLPSQNKGYNIASQDLDGDGKPEIVVIHQPNPGPGSFTIFKNNSTIGSASFGSAVNVALTRNPQAINIADINSDQKPDILIVGSGGSSSPANALMVFENKMLAPSISIDLQPISVYSVCDGATPTITTSASGTTNIAYQWQIFDTNSGAYLDLTNTGGYSGVSASGFTINSTGNFGAGTYRCKISGDYAPTVYTNTVSFSVNALPPTPVASDVNNCGPGSVTITATGGSNGQYLWYDQNGLISGQNNSTYVTSVLSSTTTYSVAITNGTCVSPKTSVNANILNSNCAPLTITTQPSGSNVCVGDVATFTTGANGTTNIAYQWQYSLDGVAPFSDIANSGAYSNATTATLGVNTSGNVGAGFYRCKISGDFATTVYTSNVVLVVNSIPTAPTTQGSSACPSSLITLTASGGTNGQYRWYTVSSGGTAISGEVNNTYQTPPLTATTTYYVSINNGTCESARTAVIATINNCTPPAIQTEPLATQIGGKITLDLKPLINTANLDLTSLQIISQPTSGATASIDANGILTIDYNGKSFAGQEQITIKACDQNGQCATQDFKIEVAGDIVVYNGVSPNGANPKLVIQYIDILPETKNNTVYIFDRWENQVWSGSNYDNNAVVFTGLSSSGGELPSGVYFYKIDFASGKKTKTGFIALRRQ